MNRLFHSRNGLRYYLLHGMAIAAAAVVLLFAVTVWQVFDTGRQTLPKDTVADAAVVLGAAAWDKRPSPVFRERINHAIALYQSHRVNKIVFTGGSPKAGFMTEAEVGRRYAIKQGIPAHDILMETASRNTYENLQNIRPVLRSNSIADIIIVSDPYHLARAKEMAHDLDLNAEVSPTPTTRYEEGSPKRRFLLQESYSLFLYRLEKQSSRVWDFITRRK